MQKRDRVVVAVYPVCGHFAAPEQVVRPDGSCGDRVGRQCADRATMALLDDEGHVCGEFCPEHGELCLAELLAVEPRQWSAVPILRGNPVTGVVEPRDRSN
jgi:hypothetical protein